MNYRLIIGLILICLVVVFIVQNAAIVEIQVFFWTIAMSRVLLMVILLSVGILVGWLLKTYWLFRKYPEEE
jgi:uncharacterized integral membrane protein